MNRSTAHMKPEDLFKVSDYFTGVDRSYFRSLYEFLGVLPNGRYLVRHLMLDGFVGAMEIEMHPETFVYGDYRHATPEEVKKYLDTKRCETTDRYTRTS